LAATFTGGLGGRVSAEAPPPIPSADLDFLKGKYISFVLCFLISVFLFSENSKTRMSLWAWSAQFGILTKKI
jgi:hypothetical protein